MRIRVDIERSLYEKRIIRLPSYKRDWSAIGLYVVIATGFLFCFFAVLFLSLKAFLRTGSVHWIALLLMAIYTFVAILVLFGLYQEDRLIGATGGSLEENRKLIVSILKSKYKTDLVFEGDKMVTYHRRATIWKFSLRIIVLFEGDNVFINIARFSVIDVKSVVHEFFSYFKARSILKEFKEQLSS